MDMINHDTISLYQYDKEFLSNRKVFQIELADYFKAQLYGEMDSENLINYTIIPFNNEYTYLIFTMKEQDKTVAKRILIPRNKLMNAYKRYFEPFLGSPIIRYKMYDNSYVFKYHHIDDVDNIINHGTHYKNGVQYERWQD